ncbi:MAG: gluconate 2-dehydrogenase subunit 3 family protein [Acidobacteria bacterium]|nr:MAG: gluconate 2-dehydrogenase subunit 3 family protein [Acidobacteriota bacterium]
MTKRIEEEANQGRRGVLKTLVMGAGGLTTLPILGQARPARTAMPAMSGMDMSSDDVDAIAQTGANWKPQFFDAHQNETLIALTDLIIPTTDTPGAKSALVNRYLDLRYNEESSENQQEIIQALAWFDGRSLALHNKPFVSLNEAQQTDLLKPLADPAKARPEDEAGVKAFSFIKGLTIFGYYTSKIGLDQELQYQGDTYNMSFPGACTHPEHQS